MTRMLTWLAVATATLLIWAPDAYAEDDLRSIIQEEVQSYLASQEAPAAASASSDSNTFKVYWKNGLRFDTNDGKVKLKFGGRIMFDAAAYSDEDYRAAGGVELSDGVEFRRLRLYNAGQIGKHVKFKAQVDFASNPTEEFSFKDVYIDFGNLRDCVGCGMPDVRVGHFFTPFGLEAQTSSKYITFMERGLPTVLTPGRLTGLALHDSWLGDRLSYAVGAFVEGTEDGEDASWEDDGWGVAARVVWTPWKDCDCECKLWQIGASVWQREELGSYRVRQRPESHVTSHRPIDTGSFLAESATHWALETAFVYGPLSIQAEYINADVTSDEAGDPSYTGWYAFASYWLTGECRHWSKGNFGRASPCCDWLDDDCCCKGGWEIAARISNLDLNDGNLAQWGGEMTSYTLGLNWHLNPNTRIMFNAVYADVDSTTGGQAIDESILAFQMRFQIDW